ncbi:MAG TPA: hypothetical protein VL463_01240 [Kofleriaceae bacterium]|jgi:hypothetical protein|nr:hypothetical protein [Kofleriaceae bacterium]
MSATATATLHPDEKFKAGKAGQSLFRLGLVGFIIFIAASLIFSTSAASHYTAEDLKAAPTLSASGMGRFFYAYLIGWSWILSIALGSLLFVLIHHAVKAKWSVTTRRLAEILSSTILWIGVAGLVFVIPVLAGNKDIYYWAHPDAHFPGAPGKSGWLSPAAWAARYAFYFIIWIAIAKWFEAKSRKMDEIGDVAEEGHTKTLSARMRWLSYPMIVVYALSVNYAGYDFLMGTAPKWFSTIYSVNFFGGCMMAAYASISLFAWMLQRSGRLTRSVNAEHYQDLGKMLFAFTFFWTYTAFSQFMLIWYANVPEETVFYNYRMFSEWSTVSWILLFCQFAIPFTFLLSRWTKRILPVFVAFCIWQMLFHWVDLYWNVMPHYHWGADIHGSAVSVTGPLSGPVDNNTISFNPVDVTAWLAMLFFFVAAVGRGMRGNLIPIKDPNLGASLAHENY